MGNTSVLLIGGEGYVGNILSRHLLELGYGVVSFDNLLYNNYNCVIDKANYEKYEFIYGDICNEKLLKKHIDKVDSVVLLAGLVGDPITKKYPVESEIINDDGVRSVINICADSHLEKFIFISTCSNYGLLPEGEVANENTPLNPLSLYAKSKVAAEKHILSLKDNQNFHPTILRFATAFGLSQRMRFDLTISEFTRELAVGNELLVYDESTWRPYCHLKDFARLIEIVLNAKRETVSFEVFNAGGEKNNATKEMIVNKISSLIGKVNVRYGENGSDPRNYRVDFSKVKSILGFEPIYSIDNGIEELLKMIKQNIFTDISANKKFHGNYSIRYRFPS